MSTVVAMTLLRARARIIALAAGFAAFIFLVGLSYASIDQNTIRTLVDGLPPALKAFSGAADIASPSGYLGASYIHPVPLTILGVLVISLTSGVTRDRESGAAELVLSRPLPPRHWLAGQAIALGIGLGVVVAAGTVGGLSVRAIVGDLGPASPRGVVAAGVGALLLFGAIAGVSLLIAVVVPRGGQAVGWAAGFVVVSYALNYLAQVWTVVDRVAPLSVFNHYDPGVIVADGSIPSGSAITLATVALAGVLAAHLAVDRRDLAGT